MPRASKESTLSRQWELMRLIPNHSPGKTASELQNSLATAGYQVTKRTIERDLNDLAAIFPLMSNEQSKPYEWHWQNSSPLTIPGMGLAEAVSLGLLEDILRQLVPEGFYHILKGRFSEARKKLEHLPDNPYAQWSDLVRYVPPGVSFLPPEVIPAIIREVQEALLQKKQITVEYLSANSKQSKELLIQPLALIQQGVRSYLLGTTFNYEKPVFYAIHRMISVVATGEKSRQPQNFSLETFLNHGGAQFGGGKVITLKAKTSEDLAAVLEETPLSTQQKIVLKKGVRILTVTLFDSWQLRYWILSQGSSILVQQPKSLKNDIIAELEETLKSYTEDQ